MNKKVTAQSVKSKKEEEKFLEDLAIEVENDFINRRKEKLSLERQWELNMNFFIGNQYCKLSEKGELIYEDKTYYWQNKEVFNHIAPIIESRLAKFSRVTPVISVRPNSNDDDDVSNAYLAKKLVEGAFNKTDIDEIVRQVTSWSEVLGTAFYKVVWNNEGGNAVGNLNGTKVYEGDVEIIPVSPFEIFPDNLYAEQIEDLRSIIHAKALPVSLINEKYNVKLKGTDIDIYDLSLKPENKKEAEKRTVKDSLIVIERYEAPSVDFPNGRVITVADGKVLYIGELPYKNGKDGRFGFPFIKQESIKCVGRFFGTSIIERLIPVQRAYNAVKNRKHEFMNRLSMGIMTVEDGSIDTDDLIEEGLTPGKVLVYRQGSNAPKMMSETSIPPDFDNEEEKLINEFVIISGVSDVSSSSSNAKLSSGSALQLLINQDNERMTVGAEIIRKCYLKIAYHILKLYAQFTRGLRAVKYLDEFNNTKILYAEAKSANSDDVYLESENELKYSEDEKKNIIFKLYDSGILENENGEMSAYTKEKVLSLLGYNDLDSRKNISRLHEDKAKKENDIIRKEVLEIDVIDDHNIHIDEHTRYFLSEFDELTKEEREKIIYHISEHKKYITVNKVTDIK